MLSVRLATSERGIPESGVLCMALAHNEAKRVADFLHHHRALGVAHFLILDDGSSDGTYEYLRAQSDVTLFVPRGTNYKEHKVAWRKDILDRYASGRWVLLPDLDELFVYPQCDGRGIAAFAAHLDEEGAEAVFAPMVEMYADARLDDTVYQPGQSLLAAFPYFDADGYRLVRPRLKHLLLYPTPPLEMYGGPRERLFYDFSPHTLTGARGWTMRRFAHLGRTMRTGFWERAGNTLARLALSGKAPRPPLVMSKLAMVKWRSGLRFSGGPHSVSQSLTLSEIWGALLHFKFMDLPGEVAYRIARQQPIAGATHYKRLEAKGGFDRSPMYESSRRYGSWRDLLECALLRSTPAWGAAPGPSSASKSKGGTSAQPRREKEAASAA
jgi:Glycosyl transferase family 2